MGSHSKDYRRHFAGAKDDTPQHSVPRHENHPYAGQGAANAGHYHWRHAAQPTEQPAGYWTEKKPERRTVLPRGEEYKDWTLKFTPNVWSKLLFMRDYGPTEIGGFGVARDPQDLLLVSDFYLLPQVCTETHIDFDDSGVDAYLHRMVKEGLHPYQFMRVWMHTHPGNSARPSTTDEQTFDEIYKKDDFAVMFIIARGGATYTRLRVRSKHGPYLDREINSCVEFYVEYDNADMLEWDDEYLDNVRTKTWVNTVAPHAVVHQPVTPPSGKVTWRLPPQNAAEEDKLISQFSGYDYYDDHDGYYNRREAQAAYDTMSDEEWVSAIVAEDESEDRGKVTDDAVVVADDKETVASDAPRTGYHV